MATAEDGYGWVEGFIGGYQVEDVNYDWGKDTAGRATGETRHKTRFAQGMVYEEWKSNKTTR
jgi:hypothetical protein